MPEGFIVEWHTTDWDRPVDIDFDKNGLMYVTEKEGTVWIVKGDQKSEQPLVDISDEVGNWGDQGLLSFALDPHFEENGYFYLYYVVDRYHLFNADLPSYNPLRNWYWGATIVRVTRYQTDESREQTDYSSRQVLIGESFDNGIPSLYTSHTGGSLVFGDDGSLLISTGDGSTWKQPYGGNGPPFYEEYVEQALKDNIIREDEEVGGFRPQLINNRNGKILRIDPLTGAGLSSNPYFDEADPYSAKSQVFAMGFRNLWKMKLREGTGSSDPSDGLPGSLYGIDVGNAHWEELNVIRTGGNNYGWPLFEGMNRMPEFNVYETTNKQINKTNDCGEAFRFKDLIQSPIVNYPFNQFTDPCNESLSIDADITHVMVPPLIGFGHYNSGGGFWVPNYGGGTLGRLKIGDSGTGVYGESFGEFGQCGLVGGFYDSEVYPEEYHGKLFIADFTRGWIKCVETDLNDELLGMNDFFRDTIEISHLEINPADGNVYFIDFPRGIKRITYGQNSKPVAIGKSDVQFGQSPLTINFSAEESYDPNGDPIDIVWDFGNGNLSTESTPAYTFESTTLDSRQVTLTVTDDEGLSSTTELLISLNNTPPQVDINSFKDGDTYSVNGVTYLDLAAFVEDAEHLQNELSYSWNVFLGHNTHEHPESTITDKVAEIGLLPAGCDGEQYYYRIQLSVTDPLGLIGTDEKRLIPDCVGSFVDLFSFDVRQRDGIIQLDWVTLRENGVEEFEIQRLNRATNEFETLHQIDGYNLPQQVQKYNFTDSDPFLNLNVYRIKMKSSEGEIAFSEEKEIYVIPSDALFLFPNPVRDKIQLLYGSDSTVKEFYLYDISGALVMKKTLSDNENTLNVSNLIPGVYTYQLFNGVQTKNGKLVKE